MTLASLIRRRSPGLSWSGARNLVEGGRVELDGQTTLDAAARVSCGQTVAIRREGRREPRSPSLIVYEDRHVVVVDKPAGLSSVPYQRGERGTVMDEIRAAWRERGRPLAARALYVVHRLDKDTSGLLIFARTRVAEKTLQAQFRARKVKRVYLCVAHGAFRSGTIASRLVTDRGDGLRGSTLKPAQGKPAITHVRVLERLDGATLCAVELETGRTHQIRIHLAERGHPVVGERVYIRDFSARGGKPISSPRLLLHAASLTLAHPVLGRSLFFESPLPADFSDELDRLRP